MKLFWTLICASAGTGVGYLLYGDDPRWSILFGWFPYWLGWR